jgi:hypothetical protein
MQAIQNKTVSAFGKNKKKAFAYVERAIDRSQGCGKPVASSSSSQVCCSTCLVPGNVPVYDVQQEI